MTKKDIAKLVVASYTKDTLDSKKVERIVKLLKRAELKIYIRGLKLSEKSKTISLVLPSRKLYNKTLTAGNKRIEILEDPSLILGAKIIDNDTVIDMSLKNNLDTFIQSL